MLRSSLFLIGMLVANLPALSQGPAPIADLSTCAKPVWPQASLRQGQQGTVTLAFQVGQDGKVIESRIVNSSGHELLDIAAREALARCQFSWTGAGARSAAWVNMQYAWKLNEAARPTAEQWRAAQAAADGGSAQAQYDLAMMYFNERGIAGVNPAMPWLRLAAAQNHADAQVALGLQLQAAGSKTEAAGLLRQAAEQGNARGQYTYALALLDGNGVPRSADTALQWLHKSAAQDHLNSQGLLGALLMKFAHTPEQKTAALTLLQKAAAMHHVAAQTALARAYAQGDGVVKDHAQAASLYNKAALAGDLQALLGLADMYERGLGVPVDRKKAVAYREMVLIESQKN